MRSYSRTIDLNEVYNISDLHSDYLKELIFHLDSTTVDIDWQGENTPKGTQSISVYHEPVINATLCLRMESFSSNKATLKICGPEEKSIDNYVVNLLKTITPKN